MAFMDTVIGGVIAMVASAATTWLAHVYERSKSSANFQRDTLIQLQESIAESMRFLARAHFETLDNLPSETEGRKALLSEEVDEGMRKNMLRSNLLVERVKCEAIREKFGEFRSRYHVPIDALTRSDADKKFSEMQQLAISLNGLIGTEFRTL